MHTVEPNASLLIGRRAEIVMIARALAGARDGGSAALVVSGGPGIGKSALLAATRQMAAGFLVVSGRGIVGESALAYAGLAEVLRPLMHLVGALPDDQRRALEGALAIGPPQSRDRFTTYAATLGLLAAAAEAGPVLCLIDDAHWMDAPSAEALLFAARRLADEGVVMLVATRPLVTGGPRTTGLPAVHLGGLADVDARRLLRDRLEGPELAPWVEDAVLEAARGNPMALMELPRSLSAAQRRGEEPLPQPIRPGQVVVAAFRHRLEALDAGARLAATLAACSTDGDAAHVLAALGARGGSRADVDAAVAGGVLSKEEGRLRFTHPLLQAVTVELTAGPDRRAAHRVLAQTAGPGERRAWHGAEAVVGPDEAAAAALADLARVTAGRGAALAAGVAYHRAARLSPDPEARAQRLLAAAGCAMEGGRPPWALLLAREAADTTENPLLRDGVDYLRGTALLITGDVAVAHRVLAAPPPAGTQAPRPHAAERLALAMFAAMLSDDLPAAFAAARRALGTARVMGDDTSMVSGVAAMALTHAVAGDMRRARELVVGVAPVVARLPIGPLTAHHIAHVAFAATNAEEFGLAHDVVTRLIDGLRAMGSVATLPFPLGVLAAILTRVGRWPEALSAARDAVTIGEECGQDTSVAFALATLLRLQAAMGHTDVFPRSVAGVRQLVERTGAHSVDVRVTAAVGLLELGMGRASDAVEVLAPLATRGGGFGVIGPGPVPWRQDLIEALVRCGERDAAWRELRVFADQAQRSGGRLAAACVERCRGMLVPTGPDRHFQVALAAHEVAGQPFERARTQLAYAERLRRDRRRAEARGLLGDALDTFEALGASPWVQRARVELDAIGTPTRSADPVTDRLTPRELQVALAVADGISNREAAARLFLSEKTIERHLGSVYRKLGLRSRSQLALRFARPG